MLRFKTYPFVILIVALIVTAITSLFENPFFPILFPSTMGQLYLNAGGVVYGFILPFKVVFSSFVEYDWISFFINFAIFSFIVWKIEERLYWYSRRKRRHR